MPDFNNNNKTQKPRGPRRRLLLLRDWGTKTVRKPTMWKAYCRCAVFAPSPSTGKSHKPQMKTFQVPGTLQNVVISKLVRSRMFWSILRCILCLRSPGTCFKAFDVHTRYIKYPETVKL